MFNQTLKRDFNTDTIQLRTALMFFNLHLDKLVNVLNKRAFFKLILRAYFSPFYFFVLYIALWHLNDNYVFFSYMSVKLINFTQMWTENALKMQRINRSPRSSCMERWFCMLRTFVEFIQHCN